MKILLVFALIVGQALFLTPALQAQAEYNALIKEAAAYLPDELEKADSVTVKLLTQLSQNGPVDDTIFAKANFLMGQVRQYQGSLNIAASYYKKALESAYCQKMNSVSGACWNNLAITYEQQSQFKEALEAYHKSLENAEFQRDSTSIAETWINISLLDNRSGNNTKAIMECGIALDYYRRHDDTLHMAYCYQNIAFFYSKTDLKVSKDYSLEALRLYTAIHNAYGIAKASVNVAMVFVNNGEYEKAKKILLETQELCTKHEFKQTLATVYRIFADIELQKGGDFDLAKEYLDKAASFCSMNGQEDNLFEVLLCKVKLNAKFGDYDGFIVALEEYLSLQKKVLEENSLHIFHEIQVIYDVNKLITQKKVLQEGNSLLSSQLFLAILFLLGAVVAICIIIYQNIRLRSAMKTMYKMNVTISKTVPQPLPETDIADLSSLKDENIPIINLYNEIVRRIDKEKLYLNPAFSVQDLCLMLNRSRGYISKSIAEGGGTSFASLVNEFRVNEARRLLAEQATELPSMVTLAEKTGFGTRQSFYRSFKTLTGFTPKEYMSWGQKTPDVEPDLFHDDADQGAFI
jgi:AraC-like DNA-binding protein/Flp pilus assembly protein TadD